MPSLSSHQPKAELLSCGRDLGLSLRAARGPPLKNRLPPGPRLTRHGGLSVLPLTNEREVTVSYLAGKSQCQCGPAPPAIKF